MCVGLAIVSMVGTNIHDSKLIKGDSAPGPNEIGPGAGVRSGPIGPRPVFFSFFLIFILQNFFFFFNFFFSFFFSAVTSVGRISTLRKNDYSECRNRNRFS